MTWDFTTKVELLFQQNQGGAVTRETRQQPKAQTLTMGVTRRGVDCR